MNRFGILLTNFSGFSGIRACDKEAIQRNGEEATRKFEPRASQMMILEARNIGNAR